MKIQSNPNSNLKKKLSEEQYQVTQLKGTEPPFTGQYYDNHETGMYHCVVCNIPLFSSDSKYDSASGWPSFYKAVDEGNVKLQEDSNHGMNRTEVVCAKCDAHLGHLFEDGPQPTGQRFCINSCSLDFKKRKR